VGFVGRVALFSLALAAGCGGTEAAGDDRPPRYDLTITYWATGRGGEARSATLTCDPDGGSHPDPVSACDALLDNEEALEPVAGDVACTQIYGGDQVATLSGAGVNASFSRANGCEISRWDKLAPLLDLSG
jgi:Subtilisin inhibitor-like